MNRCSESKVWRILVGNYVAAEFYGGPDVAPLLQPCLVSFIWQHGHRVLLTYRGEPVGAAGVAHAVDYLVATAGIIDDES